MYDFSIISSPSFFFFYDACSLFSLSLLPSFVLRAPTHTHRLSFGVSIFSIRRLFSSTQSLLQGAGITRLTRFCGAIFVHFQEEDYISKRPCSALCRRTKTSSFAATGIKLMSLMQQRGDQWIQENFVREGLLRSTRSRTANERIASLQLTRTANSSYSTQPLWR